MIVQVGKQSLKMLGLVVCWVWISVSLSHCSFVGCDAVCNKQESCRVTSFNREKCMEACRLNSDSGNLCQAYYNCWNNKACGQIASCVDFKALCK